MIIFKKGILSHGATFEIDLSSKTERSSMKVKTGVKSAELSLLDKYKNQIGKRADFIDLNVRGEKPRKIAEIAAVLKLIGTGDSFKIPVQDFERAYGVGKKGRTYMKTWLKHFGITNPRCEPSEDMIHIWMRGAVKEAK